jgi:NAD(P)-dependent dehydrogenase (short-subunit alcohol dehydrogenase family)
MNIIVTGASKGIGFEVAAKLAQDGNNTVLAIARSAEGLSQLPVNEFGNLHSIPFDLGDEDYSRLVDRVVGVIPCVDALVNNAGYLVARPFAELGAQDFDQLFEINVKGPFRLIQALLPYFSRGSHIVNIGSMGGFQGSVKFPGLSLYSASKAALAVLSECLALELKDLGISANCLALGSAQTEMLSKAFPGYKAPLSAADMGAFIAEFTVDGHKWFNGKVLPVSLSTP